MLPNGTNPKRPAVPVLIFSLLSCAKHLHSDMSLGRDTVLPLIFLAHLKAGPVGPNFGECFRTWLGSPPAVVAEDVGSRQRAVMSFS